MMRVFACAVVSSSLFHCALSTAAPSFQITQLGFTDGEHTRNDGYRFSSPVDLNGMGELIGLSERFNSGIIQLGQSAWLYDGMTMTNIGLTDSEHTRNDGLKSSEAISLNHIGNAVGHSERYNGGSISTGQSAWLYNGSTTINLGLLDAEHTGSTGRRSSTVRDLNEADSVVGVSSRLQGSGQSAWLYNGSATINIGLTGPGYTRSSNFKFSDVFNLNDAGQAIGQSQRWEGLQSRGDSAWLYTGSMTVVLGFTGPDNTRFDGYQHSYPFDLNEKGWVVGASNTYVGTFPTEAIGQSAWLYNGSTTIEVGLSDAEHSQSDGSRENVARLLNESGIVVGSATRYDSRSAEQGTSSWLYDGGSTKIIGLRGNEHTRSDGYKESSFYELTEAGQVNGVSRRYNGGGDSLGLTAWFYDGTNTREIGLTGAEYTRADGYRLSSAQYMDMNDAGQVASVSFRYSGSIDNGQDAWFYDPSLDQTIPLQLSLRSDGYAFSTMDYLGDDGTVLGTYRLFDSLDNDLGLRAYYFSVADGLHDLGSLVAGGLTGNGWTLLANAIESNSLGLIAGRGALSSGGEMAYLLGPIVPEPSGIALMLCSMLFAARVRVR